MHVGQGRWGIGYATGPAGRLGVWGARESSSYKLRVRISENERFGALEDVVGLHARGLQKVLRESWGIPRDRHGEVF